MTPREVVEQRHAKGPSQISIQASMRTKEEREAVCLEIARMFYECGIPFNVANSRQYEIAMEAIAQYGSGFKPPTFHELRGPFLEKIVKEMDKDRVRHEEAWKLYGCTLMSDGWTDKRGRHLINFLANSPEGTFLRSVNASAEVHDAQMLASFLEEKIEEIGKEYVVQIVTDNGANYKAAGKILMERIPTLFWTPCVAHCLDLMLEDIGKLKEFKKVIAQGRYLTTFIYRHTRILAAMREKTGGMDTVRPAATRFSTAFLTMASLHKHRDALRNLFESVEWTSCKLAKTSAGIKCKALVIATAFWNAVEDCIRASIPLIRVLRVVDGDERPAMPEVKVLMDTAMTKMECFCTQNKKPLLDRMLKIVDDRWVDQMWTPLYGAALFLNAGKFYGLLEQSAKYEVIAQLRSDFNDCLAKMVEDEALVDKIDRQAILYENRREVFANKMASQHAKTRSPIDWWRAYGAKCIELHRFARRIIGLCASSSGCERNWSTFEFMHTKKRNRLEHQNLNNLVYVSYNRKMTARFQKRCENGSQSFDPLVLEEFDWDNEWVSTSANKVQGHDGLTWDLVDEASGASMELRGRQFPRKAHGTGKTHGATAVYTR